MGAAVPPMSRSLFISWGLEPEEDRPVLHILEVVQGVPTLSFSFKTPTVSADRSIQRLSALCSAGRTIGSMQQAGGEQSKCHHL